MKNIKISDYGYVAQQDEHESSKFADAGSNPVIPNRYTCENCNKQFETGYGRKNRFCSRSCCTSFNAKKAQMTDVRLKQLAEARSKIKNPQLSKVTCEVCGEVFEKQAILMNHIRWHHLDLKRGKRREKGKTTLVKDIYICEFCKKKMHTTKAAFSSHVAKCKDNPNRTICKDTHNRRPCEFCGLKNSTNIHRIYCEKNPNKKDGTWKGRHHSEETKKKLSEIGRNNKYRRIMRRTQEYKGVLYDSSWEVEFAKRLEELGIGFERPKIPIEYKDAENNTHNYFPDFYIPKINKFVEIKNPYLFNNDPKVQILKERIDIIWLTDLDLISKFNI